MNKAQIKHDEEMAGSIWDWIVTAEKEYGYPIRLQVLRTDRRGVFVLKAQAMKMDAGKPVGLAHQYAVEWPRSAHATLSGALLGSLVTLEHQLCIEIAPDRDPEGA